MNRILFFIIHLFFLFSGAFLFAQGPENMVIHRDKAFYVTGETIWYKAYFPDKSVKSQILHIEIIHPEGVSLFHQKLAIKDNQAWGDIAIPETWPSGMYTLRAYTLWNLNFTEQHITQLELPIYSYEEKKPKSYLPPQPEVTPQNTNINIDVQLNPSSPTRREVSKLKLTVNDLSGKPIDAKLSVSITDARVVSGIPSTISQHQKQESLPSAGKSSDKFEHQKKLIVKGEAWEEDGNKLLQSDYFIVWSVDDIKPIWTKVKDGKFAVEMEPFQGSKTLQLHDFSPFRSRNPKVKLWSTDYIKPINPIATSELSAAKTVGAYLNLQQKKNLFNIVFQLESPIEEIPAPDTLQSPFLADKTYFLDKYIPFASLESFVGEGMPWVAVKRINGEKMIMMENYDTKDPFELPPLFLIDHYLSFNNQEMLKLPWKSLRLIEQFMRTKTLDDQFGLLGRFGVLSLYTRSGIPNPKFYEEENTFTFQGLHEPAKFPAPYFMESMYSKDKVPDFNATIYWNPEVTTNESGEAEVRFIQLDSRGEFEIRIEGMTKNGEIFSRTMKYSVN